MNTPRIASAFASVALAFASLVGAGCGGSSYCELSCECKNPDSDRKIDDCIESCELQIEDAIDIADNHGCSEPYDRLAQCLEETGTCRESLNLYETSCGDELRDLNSCL